jgi:aminoglycoside phosphotransferase (APT) family kinase protein
VLRRPPLHGLTPSAHDMAREYRVVAALQDTPVPVARALTMRNDDSVLGAPFQMVEYVPGRVVRFAGELEALGDKDTINACVDSLIRVLADLHSLDPEAVGLGDFGRPSGYLERQVRRWGSQWELVRLQDDPRDGDVKRLYSALAQAIPKQSHGSVVHGDYRIDNTLLDAEDPTRVLAVLDWEMSTLGDPLSDAALMCVYRHPMFDLVHADAAWTSPLIPSADELAHRYSLAAGRALDHWGFYMALAYFKLAIIAAGIAFRGRMGGSVADDADKVDEAVAPLIAAGLTTLTDSGSSG